jgi:luciferase family oxidoreductase group 1
VELMAYLSEEGPQGRVHAIPGQGTRVPVWMLGSSLYGAQLAAALGLPYAFASHFAPAELDRAMEIYRAQFRPSPQLDRPYAMPGLSVIAAETDEEARFLFTSLQQAFVNLRSGRPGRLPPPVEGYAERLESSASAMLAQALSCAVVGSPATVRKGLADFQARTAADELIVTAQIFDHDARRRSFEILADVAGLAPAAAAAE